MRLPVLSAAGAPGSGMRFGRSGLGVRASGRPHPASGVRHPGIRHPASGHPASWHPASGIRHPASGHPGIRASGIRHPVNRFIRQTIRHPHPASGIDIQTRHPASASGAPFPVMIWYPSPSTW
jgi:hypothetical protein